MKKLCSFYCRDCDNAWLEIIDLLKEDEDLYKCDYCGKRQEAEEVPTQHED